MTTLSHHTSDHSGRALVLGGGGSAGNAWLIGVIAGLFEAGIDLTTADLTIGTSAGATAAAQLAGAAPTTLLAEVLNAEPIPARPGGAPGPMAGQLARLRRMIDASDDLVDMRRRMGIAALELEGSSDPTTQARWRATVASRLHSEAWPTRAVWLTAVDAHSGDPVEFDSRSGVDLVDAVAASCAGGFAYSIGGTPYIDGGYRRSSENADLAAGYERVLVLSPLGGRSLHPEAWGSSLATQVDELRASGSRVETVLPDEESLTAFGDNMMDYATRQAVARAGYSQGQSLAGHLADFWG